MDSQKVTQVLKYIFRKCGPEILCKEEKFESHLIDLLNGNNYINERTVLQRALKTAVLMPLADQNFTEDGLAGRIKERLIKENQMGKDEADFVVDCIIAARCQAEDISFIRTKSLPSNTRATQVDSRLFAGEEERWDRVEKHLLHLEELLRRQKEKNMLRLNAAVIAFFLMAAAVLPGRWVKILPKETEDSQSTSQAETDYTDSEDDEQKSSISGPSPQQTQG